MRSMRLNFCGQSNQFFGLSGILRGPNFWKRLLSHTKREFWYAEHVLYLFKTYLIEILLNIKHVFTVTVVHDSLNSKLKILNGANRVRQNFHSSHPCMVKSEKSLVEKLWMNVFSKYGVLQRTHDHIIELEIKILVGWGQNQFRPGDS